MTIQHSKNTGFTLIELIVVIVILGILAATAAPKFIDLRNDAIAATLQNLTGTLKSANTMVYTKAIIAGKDKLTPGSLDINGVTVTTAGGYILPSADNISNTIDGSFESMTNANDNFTADWGIYLVPGGSPTGSTTVYIYPKGYNTLTPNGCNLLYNVDISQNEPTYYSLSTDGC